MLCKCLRDGFLLSSTDIEYSGIAYEPLALRVILVLILEFIKGFQYWG